MNGTKAANFHPQSHNLQPPNKALSYMFMFMFMFITILFLKESLGITYVLDD